MFSFIFTEYCVTLILSKSSRKRYIEFCSSVISYLSAHKVPNELKSNLSTFLKHQWVHNRGATIARLDPLLIEAPKTIRRKAKFAHYAQCLRTIPMFQDTCEDLLIELAHVAHSYILPPGATVIDAGDRASDIFYIFDGYCRLVSALPSDQILRKTSVIGQGAHFPIIEIFYNQPSLVTVTTLSTCCLITFDYRLVRQVMKLFPSFEEEVNEILIERRHLYDNVFSG